MCDSFFTPVILAVVVLALAISAQVNEVPEGPVALRIHDRYLAADVTCTVVLTTEPHFQWAPWQANHFKKTFGLRHTTHCTERALIIEDGWFVLTTSTWKGVGRFQSRYNASTLSWRPADGRVYFVGPERSLIKQSKVSDVQYTYPIHIEQQGKHGKHT